MKRNLLRPAISAIDVGMKKARSSLSASASPPAHYVSLYEHIRTELVAWTNVKKNDISSSSIRYPPPFFAGISAPQGCGKTTLVTALQKMFADDGLKCAVCSLDDFYLTRKEQVKLSLQFPANPMLQCRGNAGTHDLGLL
jgi:pantothenate kinase-related protein Tda10